MELPTEILLKIANNLSLSDLSNLDRVSTFFHSIAKETFCRKIKNQHLIIEINLGNEKAIKIRLKFLSYNPETDLFTWKPMSVLGSKNSRCVGTREKVIVRRFYFEEDKEKISFIHKAYGKMDIRKAGSESIKGDEYIGLTTSEREDYLEELEMAASGHHGKKKFSILHPFHFKSLKSNKEKNSPKIKEINIQSHPYHYHTPTPPTFSTSSSSNLHPTTTTTTTTTTATAMATSHPLTPNSTSTPSVPTPSKSIPIPNTRKTSIPQPIIEGGENNHLNHKTNANHHHSIYSLASIASTSSSSFISSPSSSTSQIKEVASCSNSSNYSLVQKTTPSSTPSFSSRKDKGKGKADTEVTQDPDKDLMPVVVEKVNSYTPNSSLNSTNNNKGIIPPPSSTPDYFQSIPKQNIDLSKKKMVSFHHTSTITTSISKAKTMVPTQTDDLQNKRKPVKATWTFEYKVEPVIKSTGEVWQRLQPCRLYVPLAIFMDHVRWEEGKAKANAIRAKKAYQHYQTSISTNINSSEGATHLSSTTSTTTTATTATPTHPIVNTNTNNERHRRSNRNRRFTHWFRSRNPSTTTTTTTSTNSSTTNIHQSLTQATNVASTSTTTPSTTNPVRHYIPNLNNVAMNIMPNDGLIYSDTLNDSDFEDEDDEELNENRNAIFKEIKTRLLDTLEKIGNSFMLVA